MAVSQSASPNNDKRARTAWRCSLSGLFSKWRSCSSHMWSLSVSAHICFTAIDAVSQAFSSSSKWSETNPSPLLLLSSVSTHTLVPMQNHPQRHFQTAANEFVFHYVSASCSQLRFKASLPNRGAGGAGGLPPVHPGDPLHKQHLKALLFSQKNIFFVFCKYEM